MDSYEDQIRSMADEKRSEIRPSHLNRETCTKLYGHHMAAGSTRYRRNIPAHPKPRTWQHHVEILTNRETR